MGGVPAACSIMHQYHNQVLAVLRAQPVAGYETVFGPACLNTKKSQFAVSKRPSLISVNKKITIIDKMQPSISRNKIK